MKHVVVVEGVMVMASKMVMCVMGVEGVQVVILQRTQYIVAILIVPVIMDILHV